MAENVSSKVLFHFTSSMERLKGIVRYGFPPRYCPEYTLDPDDRRAAREHHHPNRAVPMVCFCDLPLSLIRKHLEVYGNFGIGLKKRWGLRNGAAPVIYTHARAKTRSPILTLTAEAEEHSDTMATKDSTVLAVYTKPFSGPSWRNGRVHKKVEFYDEREWRYVPSVREGVPLFLDWEDYSNISKRSKLHKRLQKESALQISPGDIQYLIVPNDRYEENILELHRFIMEHYTERHSRKDAILVSTTIMTEDCIQEDT